MLRVSNDSAVFDRFLFPDNPSHYIRRNIAFKLFEYGTYTYKTILEMLCELVFNNFLFKIFNIPFVYV